MFVCNQSTTISIVCNGRSELPVVFRSWIHLYNSNFIRFINSTHNSSSSTITFDKCTLEDEGEYICQAHSSETGFVLLSNTSTKIVVEGLYFSGNSNFLQSIRFCMNARLESGECST